MRASGRLPVPVLKAAKKAEGGKIHFILIRSIGETMEYDMTAEEAVAFLAGE